LIPFVNEDILTRAFGRMEGCLSSADRLGNSPGIAREFHHGKQCSLVVPNRLTVYFPRVVGNSGSAIVVGVSSFLPCEALLIFAWWWWWWWCYRFLPYL
jgi:hypothetical protein